jgi:hypothetical protein
MGTKKCKTPGYFDAHCPSTRMLTDTQRCDVKAIQDLQSNGWQRHQSGCRITRWH